MIRESISQAWHSFLVFMMLVWEGCFDYVFGSAYHFLSILPVKDEGADLRYPLFWRYSLFFVFVLFLGFCGFGIYQHEATRSTENQTYQREIENLSQSISEKELELKEKDLSLEEITRTAQEQKKLTAQIGKLQAENDKLKERVKLASELSVKLKDLVNSQQRNLNPKDPMFQDAIKSYKNFHGIK